ncbi:MAG: sigma 54-interacting transcriptional regulator [Bacteroidales bacterium]|nr:sigma 54-interacting transcriptional regulator [Bacteroidales bacterium]
MSTREQENMIFRSHYRSERFGVKKDMQSPRIVFDGDKTHEHLKDNKGLLETAQPYIDHLTDILKTSKFIVILTDKDGCILDIRGDENTMLNAANLSMVVGASMEERSVGTNAMGTALFEDRPIQITANQHYSEAFHQWTCSAAPLHDTDGEVIGTLNLTGDKSLEHVHTLGLVISAAKAIENRIESDQIQKRLYDAQYYAFAMMNQLSFGVFAIDLHDNIIWANDTGCRAINVRRTHLINSPIQRILVAWPKIKRIVLSNLGFLDEEHSFDIPDLKEHFLLNAYLIRSQEDEIIGYLISFRPFKRLLGLVNKYAGMMASYHFEDIISKSPAMNNVIEYARTVAHSPTSLLITGESGTGKEVFAQAIHNASERKNAGFVAINCGAISQSLIESELFGYEEGAYTGALKGGRPGKFELANGGTLFLDEIGEMPLEMQVKLLRAIQEGQINRVGGSKIIPVDVRIIAATNKNLEHEIKEGRFRLDLFYRINVITIELPALKSRMEDIPILAHHFLQTKAVKLNKPMVRLSRTLLREIESYDWPGNVRELENFIEKVTILGGNININQHVSGKVDCVPQQPESDNEEFNPKTLQDIEKNAIIDTIKAYHGNMTQVAKILGIGRNTLYQKIKRYEIKLK